MFKKKILVIDDSDLMLNIIRDIIEALAMRRLPLQAARKGLDLVRKEKPDLVLLDVIMPK